MDWNEEPMDGVDPLPPLQEKKKAPRVRRPFVQRQGAGSVFGSITDYGRMAAGMGGAAQGAHLGGMIGQTMGAIARENQSRVAQQREMRRMDHDLQRQQEELQALLIRLQHERELAEKKMKYDYAMQQIADDKERGVKFSTRWKRLMD